MYGYGIICLHATVQAVKRVVLKSCSLLVYIIKLYYNAKSLRRADHSSRGVLPTVVRRCV